MNSDSCCICYCKCKKRKRLTINILILILSSVCIFLNGISIGLNELIDENKLVFQIVLIIINSAVSSIQSVQLYLEGKSKKPPNIEDETLQKIDV